MPLTVYPRWRGELRHLLPLVLRNRGLSPLARGTRHAGRASEEKSGFIPAGAGNSMPRFKYQLRLSVYPRWRGELAPGHIRSLRRCGLSPLARGTHSLDSHIVFYPRFIPAGAGNSNFYYSGVMAAPVYPRWRGELRSSFSCGLLLSGLSPLARGTPRQIWYDTSRNRFIPAGAGNSK